MRPPLRGLQVVGRNLPHSGYTRFELFSVGGFVFPAEPSDGPRKPDLIEFSPVNRR